MEERIKYLFGKYLANTCTKAEFEEVFAFLKREDSDPVFREMIRKAYEEELYAENGLEPKIMPLKEEEIVTRQPHGVFVDSSGELSAVPGLGELSPVRDTKRRRRQILSFTLTLLILAGGMIWMKTRPAHAYKADGLSAAGQLVMKKTERSEYKYLLLPDSTQVWLNSASTLVFPESFGKDKREVVLTGEAFFDVKHADKIPFIIYSGKVSTEVLGTAFNIKAYPGLEKITVSVQRGKVKVNYANKEVALLTMGQQVSIGNQDNVVKEKKVRADETSAWQAGKLIYDDYAMADIISDLERIYNVKIGIAEESVKHLRVSTSLLKESGLKKVLEVLCELTDTQLVTGKDEFTIK
ncbi:FecR family protein [Flavitalea flava]